MNSIRLKFKFQNPKNTVTKLQQQKSFFLNGIRQHSTQHSAFINKLGQLSLLIKNKYNQSRRIKNH